MLSGPSEERAERSSRCCALRHRDNTDDPPPIPCKLSHEWSGGAGAASNCTASMSCTLNNVSQTHR